MSVSVILGNAIVPHEPLVSVCIPAYNHEPYIGAAIESVLAQTIQDFEIVVTDDCSLDGTRDVVASFRDDRIRLLTLPRNSGPSVAANNNIRHARGAFIALLASDDTFRADKIEVQLKVLRDEPQVGVVFSGMNYIDENGDAFHGENALAVADQPNRGRAEWYRHFLLAGNPFSAPTAMMRRSVLPSPAPFDPRFLQVQDFDLWIRIGFQHDFFIVPEKLINYRVRPDAANASANSVRQQARSWWEYERMLGNLLDMPDDLATAAFGGDRDVRRMALPTAARIALVALDSPVVYIRTFALNAMFDLLGDPEMAGSLERAGFDYPWLFKTAAEVDPYGVERHDFCVTQMTNWEAAYRGAMTLLERSQIELAEARSAPT